MLALTLAATLASASAQYSPAFAWTSKPLAAATSAAEHLAEVAAADLASAYHALGRDGAGQHHALGAAGHGLFEGGMLDAAAPEVQLVFLADGLTTDGVRELGSQLANVDKLMKASPSSVSFPFIKPAAAQLFAGAPRVSGEEAEAFLAKRPELFTNSKSDILVVELRAPAGTPAEQVLALHDAMVGRISRAVQEGTNGNYAALFTGAGVQVSRPARRLQAVSKKSFLRTGPTLLTAQLVSLILIVIFLSGFCCLFQLQTPKRFNVDKHA